MSSSKQAFREPVSRSIMPFYLCITGPKGRVVSPLLPPHCIPFPQAESKSHDVGNLTCRARSGPKSLNFAITKPGDPNDADGTRLKHVVLLSKVCSVVLSVGILGWEIFFLVGVRSPQS